MSSAPTSAPEANLPAPDAAELDRHTRAALARAGWQEAELVWERLSESGSTAEASGDPATAARCWARALRLARESFDAADPRLAASLTNHAAALARAGDTAAADRLFAEALRVWDAARAWLLGMPLDNPARSSIFHLRMQLRHGDVYDRREREIWQVRFDTARAVTRAHASGEPLAFDGLTAWRREKPATYTDARKALAATFLLVPPR